MSRVSLLDEAAVRTPLNLQIKNVRGLAFIEDKENLGQVSVARAGLDKHNLVDLGLEEAQLLVSHVIAAKAMP